MRHLGSEGAGEADSLKVQTGTSELGKKRDRSDFEGLASSVVGARLGLQSLRQAAADAVGYSPCHIHHWAPQRRVQEREKIGIEQLFVRRGKCLVDVGGQRSEWADRLESYKGLTNDHRLQLRSGE